MQARDLVHHDHRRTHARPVDVVGAAAVGERHPVEAGQRVLLAHPLLPWPVDPLLLPLWCITGGFRASHHR